MFKLAPGVDLPASAVTQSFGILGKRGSGKTFTAGTFAEQMLAHGAQTIIFDTVGIWYGLRLRENGKTPAFDIPVLGGQHGDLDLQANMGSAIAVALVNSKSSAVIDMSSMTKGEWRKFMVDFVEKFFQLMVKDRSPVQLIFEEAQEFVPQNCPPDSARMLGAMERMCKLGRNYGIGYTLISQRPQAVNKDVLNQTECLIFMQMTGPHERKAVQGWITDVAGDDPESAIDMLPRLQQGEGIIWSPSWLQMRKQVKFNKKTTFDASATPVFGKKTKKAKQLKVLDTTALKKELQQFVEEAAANDPKLLKKRVDELQRELAKVVKVPVEVQVRTEILKFDLGPLKDKLREVTEAVGPVLEAVKHANRLLGLVQQLETILRIAEANPKAVGVVNQQQRSTQSVPAPARPVVKTPPRSVPRHEPPADGVKLKAGARRMLAALTSSGEGKLTITQMATLANIAQSGGTFSSYMSSLRLGGYIIESGEDVTITPAGRNAIAGEEMDIPSTTDEIVSLWKTKLKAGARRMLDVLVANYPNSLTKEQLGTDAKVENSGGTFSSYVSSLNRNNLIIKDGDNLKASDALFPEPTVTA